MATAPRRSIPDAHGLEPPDERYSIRAVSIANEISRRFLPAAGFSQLPGDPFGVGMRASQRSCQRERCKIRRPNNSRNEIFGITNKFTNVMASA
jgi:hypothetical protein